MLLAQIYQFVNGKQKKLHARAIAPETWLVWEERSPCGSKNCNRIGLAMCFDF
ncbi:MAG: hypothetical protein F6K40_03995 [Okeania sp. SIO3I5]|uniref:hypothetical protein n=1 Tax=Okeania sp. SIO3I5 TaxID=2607805 RepID=UPI0013BAE4C7|nr:hypothetical protein [Okeania sp. SIO3I5]NEQ35505.1 hypothetical protein [Okeania sp. SIO3I5]